MAGGVGGRLVGWDIHGFHTLEDLDIASILEEARARWLRPNEIHAILCNHNYFKINVKPLNFPPSGTIELFDRKMLRNFRKDGHNWKKKKDGKTVKEAHEHLKIGDEERIHVYYAYGEDKRSFVRRCYWLLEKKLEHIVLVHYRDTEVIMQTEASLAVHVDSNSSSTQSDHCGSRVFSLENDSGGDFQAYADDNEHPEQTSNTNLTNFEMQLHEINTLEWEDLLVTDEHVEPIAAKRDEASGFEQYTMYIDDGSTVGGHAFPTGNIQAENSLLGTNTVMNNSVHFDSPDIASFKTTEGEAHSNGQGTYSLTSDAGNASCMLFKDDLQMQNNFGRWLGTLNYSPGSVDNSLLKPSISAGHDSFESTMHLACQNTVSDHVFKVTDVSPAWAFTTETTKVLITGLFHEEWPHHAVHNLLCVCGNACIPVEIVQAGVLRCSVLPHDPGSVDLFLSLDGHKPVSQILNFEYRTPSAHSSYKSNLEEIQIRSRLACLLFSPSKKLKMLSHKVPPNLLKEARKFAENTSFVADSWMDLMKLIEERSASLQLVNDISCKLLLKNKLREWLMERIVEGGKIADLDDQGQGVIHLCAIAGYKWAVRLFSLSGLSLDYRDKHGWTALHWAAHCGREEMVANLLSAGAKASLVTDPTSENPGGCTAADLASKMGFHGIGAFLAERALVDHFKDMAIAGNVSGLLQINTSDCTEPSNLPEDELNLKDTLTAYRTAADAAARIQTAFREQSLKLRTKEALSANPETVARNIVAAMRIQHAYRHYQSRKVMRAAVHIQCTFRTWKIRKEFLNMRRQAIKIQAAFRGFQERKQYLKIIWSVGVVEKAILRWRWKRKGFRGLQVDPIEKDSMNQQESGTEDFFRVSRKQAEERVERSVVRVQALFRSKQAQKEYRRMKLTLCQAKLDFDRWMDPAVDMDA